MDDVLALGFQRSRAVQDFKCSFRPQPRHALGQPQLELEGPGHRRRRLFYYWQRALTTEDTEITEASIQILKNPRRAHPSADAHGHHPITQIAPLHLADDGCGQLGSGAAQRMPESDRAAVYVYA